MQRLHRRVPERQGSLLLRCPLVSSASFSMLIFFLFFSSLSSRSACCPVAFCKSQPMHCLLVSSCYFFPAFFSYRSYINARVVGNRGPREGFIPITEAACLVRWVFLFDLPGLIFDVSVCGISPSVPSEIPMVSFTCIFCHRVCFLTNCSLMFVNSVLLPVGLISP